MLAPPPKSTPPQLWYLEAVALPSAPSRQILATIHSGDFLRRAIPAFMRIGATLLFATQLLAWLGFWPEIYAEYERWGLVKAFVAQCISLAAVFMFLRITLLRAEQLKAVPADDFTVMRAIALFCRWVGDLALVWVVGCCLSDLLLPFGPLAAHLIERQSPATGAAISGGSATPMLGSSWFTLLLLVAGFLTYLVMYGVATAIDLGLTIEFNTRGERIGRSSL